jgi:hypothetical protein
MIKRFLPEKISVYNHDSGQSGGCRKHQDENKDFFSSGSAGSSSGLSSFHTIYSIWCFQFRMTGSISAPVQMQHLSSGSNAALSVPDHLLHYQFRITCCIISS